MSFRLLQASWLYSKFFSQLVSYFVTDWISNVVTLSISDFWESESVSLLITTKFVSQLFGCLVIEWLSELVTLLLIIMKMLLC